MFRFNCAGKPIFDERFQEAINRWAYKNGIDPKKVFEANAWDKHEVAELGQWSAGCPPIPLSMIVKSPIDTSVFEEATIIEE